MEFITKYGWLAFVVAMIGDIVVSLILAFFYKEYSISKMSISALGNPSSPVRLPFNVWMAIEGLLFLLAIPATYEYYHRISGGITITLAVFIAVFAIGACIFTCFFSVNESKDIVTTASKVHGVGSVVGFMLFLFVPLLFAILSFKNGENGIGIFSIICFIISLVFFALFVMSDKPEFENTIIKNEGLWQRLNLVFMYLPVIVITINRMMENAK